MVVGTLCACCHGAALPGLIILFGDMTDLFINNAKSLDNQTMLELVSCNNSFAHYGATLYDAFNDPDLLT